MTISTETCSVTDNGDGTTTVFNYGFKIPYQPDGVTPASHVFKTVGGVSTVLTLNVDYSIQGVGAPTGGTVTFPLSGSPLALGSTITIQRAALYEQPYSFPNQDFVPSQAEAAFDWLCMVVQQLNRRVTALGG